MSSSVSAPDRPEKAHFRPDVEGLRAVAIVAVLLFHMHVPGANGGFIGVDVFFVISGFLITGLLTRELAGRGRIDLAAFYARRFRRLLPAALLTIVVTLFASWLVLSSLRFPEVAGDAAASALYVSNIRFALNATDYLASEAAPSPLLHFWSLGVEEQFYLFWPVLIIAGARLLSVRWLGLFLGGIGILSLWLSLVWTDVAAPWAFFSLPTRAWELAVGALIAVGVLRLPNRAPAIVASGLVWTGLALIALGVVLIDTSTPYPGTAALVPVVGTALAIIGGVRAEARPARILASAVPRWLGRISYSLYLWHWPLLILVPIALGSDSLALRVLLAGVAIAIAAVSTELVEAPIRDGRLLRLPPRGSLGLAGATSVLVAFVAVTAGLLSLGSIDAEPVLARGSNASTPAPRAVATTVHTPAPTGLSPSAGVLVAGPSPAPSPPAAGTSPMPSMPVAALSASPTAVALPELPLPVLSGPLPDGLTPSLRRARDDLPRSYGDGCHLDFAEVEPGPCVYGSPGSETTVMLVGDSHAAQWLPAVERLAVERGWRVVGLTKSACPMVDLTVWNGPLKRAYRECERWKDLVLERMADEHPALVLVATADMFEVVGDGERRPSGSPEWGRALARTLARIAERAERVVLLADTPRRDDDPLECLADRGRIEDCTLRRGKMVHEGYTALEEEAVATSGVGMIAATDWICPGDECPLVMGTTLIPRDSHHMTATFATLLADRLGAALDALEPTPSP